MPTIVCVSDTHGWHRDVAVPPGDVLVHAGDITRKGELKTLVDFDDWLGTLPHRHKVVICGNHDFCFQEQPATARSSSATPFTCRTKASRSTACASTGARGSRGSAAGRSTCSAAPSSPPCGRTIPDGTDILVTHGPPAGILDRTYRGEAVGCQDLLDRVRAVRPRLHVFGHIHEAAGVVGSEGTTFVNASVAHSRPAVVFEWD